jgi:fused signal recognition particle receptor
MKFSLDKLKSGLFKTKENLLGKISQAVGLHKKIDQELLDELEEILIKSDVGPSTTAKIIEGLRKEAATRKIDDSEKVTGLLKDQVASILAAGGVGENQLASPYVIMVVGVNGTGKTTSIAKLAKDFKDQGKKVLVAACDTFRAAAGEQLSIWADRVGVELVGSMPNQDPAAVAFDAIQAACARDFDVVIADTAGRLHTKVNLMEELKKIKRVMGKALPGAPHEILLVLDATTGQNGLSQVRIFKEAVDVTGIFLTKLDGTAKGGIMIAITDEFNIPVKYIGLGEKPDDFQKFDPQWFAEALFS